MTMMNVQAGGPTLWWSEAILEGAFSASMLPGVNPSSYDQASPRTARTTRGLRLRKSSSKR